MTQLQAKHDAIHAEVFESRHPWSELQVLRKEHDEIVTALAEPFHKTPLVLGLTIPKSTYSIGYFGTQGRLALHTQNLARYVTGLPDGVIWVDPTMGGLAIPQGLRRTGYASKTVLNDRGFLSVCASRALLSGNPLPSLEQLYHDVDNVTPIVGFVSKSTVYQDVFSTEVLAYMDGYVTQYINRPEMLLALGCVLTKRHTFRSIDFDKKLTRSLGLDKSIDPYPTKKVQELQSELSGSVQPIDAMRPGLKEYLKKELKKISESWCPIGTGETHHLDVMEFSKVATGDIMYCDFAWPWRDGRPVKEYSFPLKIASLLTQQEQTNTWYWTGDTILGGVNDFLANTLPRFKFIIVNTQSSNFPNGEELRASVEQRFGKERVIDYAFIDYVSMAGTASKGSGVRMYREYYVAVKGDLS